MTKRSVTKYKNPLESYLFMKFDPQILFTAEISCRSYCILNVEHHEVACQRRYSSSRPSATQPGAVLYALCSLLTSRSHTHLYTSTETKYSLLQQPTMFISRRALIGTFVLLLCFGAVVYRTKIFDNLLNNLPGKLTILIPGKFDSL